MSHWITQKRKRNLEIQEREHDRVRKRRAEAHHRHLGPSEDEIIHVVLVDLAAAADGVVIIIINVCEWTTLIFYIFFFVTFKATFGK